jgi:mRNA interferase RelE/StbE
MTGREVKAMYKVLVNKKSRDFLNKLDEFVYKSILAKIFSLEDEPRPTGSIKLSVKNGYRIRWTVYRILYTIDDNEKAVFVYDINHRKDIYKKK